MSCAAALLLTPNHCFCCCRLAICCFTDFVVVCLHTEPFGWGDYYWISHGQGFSNYGRFAELSSSVSRLMSSLTPRAPRHGSSSEDQKYLRQRQDGRKRHRHLTAALSATSVAATWLRHEKAHTHTGMEKQGCHAPTSLTRDLSAARWCQIRLGCGRLRPSGCSTTKPTCTITLKPRSSSPRQPCTPRRLAHGCGRTITSSAWSLCLKGTTRHGSSYGTTSEGQCIACRRTVAMNF